MSPTGELRKVAEANLQAIRDIAKESEAQGWEFKDTKEGVRPLPCRRSAIPTGLLAPLLARECCRTGTIRRLASDAHARVSVHLCVCASVCVCVCARV